MIYALNYINYVFLFGFRKMSQEKTTIAQQKKVYSCGMLVQSLAKDQIEIRLDSIGILTFFKAINVK